MVVVEVERLGVEMVVEVEMFIEAEMAVVELEMVMMVGEGGGG